MSPGQITILDGWISQYTPTETFDPALDHVFTTEQIVADLSDMAEWDTNEVADYIAQAGFRVHPCFIGCPHGWIFRVKK